jgi:fructokinase
MFTVIGEALIDLVEQSGHDGDPAVMFAAHPGGSPLNVAVGLARLAQPVSLMARFGGDTFGRTLRRHAESNGVSLSAAVGATEPSTLAVVSVDEAGQAAYDFYRDNTADWQWSDSELAGIDPATTVLHTGSLASWTAPGAERVVALARSRRASGQVLISYDPNVRPLLLGEPESARILIEVWLAIAHVVKASDEDLSWLYPGRDVAEIARQWLAAGPDLVVVTRGSGGSLCVARSADGQTTGATHGGHRVAVVDTVGAGDAFMAGLLAALATTGLQRPGALGSASAEALGGLLDDAGLVAALTCTRAGANPPTREDVAAARKIV